MEQHDILRYEYLRWLTDLVCEDSKGLSYERLMMDLHNTEFVWSIPKDENRAEDGISLRYRFATNGEFDIPFHYILDVLESPCSMLEMMVALAVRCEESIMDDPTIGDRTGQWFWAMVTNLGLGSMMDDRYDRGKVIDILDRFAVRDYSPDGRGGLFRVRHGNRDMRKIEIWHQLCAYLNELA